jgi:nucleotide-binding universal stress UspA family protein
MPIETVIHAIHGFLDAEVMLEQRRTEEGEVVQQYETMEHAKRRLSDAMRDAVADPSSRPLVCEAEAYLAASTAFEQVRCSLADGIEVAGPARRLERAQQALQDMLNRYARAGSTSHVAPGSRVKRVLVGVDGSRPSEWAVEAAGRLALDLGATVKLIHVRPYDADEDPRLAPLALEREAPRESPGDLLLQERQSLLPEEVNRTCVRTCGDPAAEIVGAARRWGADFIVLGTRGRGRVSRFVLGSTAEAVVRLASCPVITVAHAPHDAPAERTRTLGTRQATVAGR